MLTGSNTNLKLYKINEVCELFGVSKATIYRLVESRKISFYKIKGNIRFSESDIQVYLQDSRIEPVR